MSKIEKMSVAQYADSIGITRQAVYRQIKEGRVVFQPATKYRPLLIVTKY